MLYDCNSFYVIIDLNIIITILIITIQQSFIKKFRIVNKTIIKTDIKIINKIITIKWLVKCNYINIKLTF